MQAEARPARGRATLHGHTITPQPSASLTDPDSSRGTRQSRGCAAAVAAAVAEAGRCPPASPGSPRVSLESPRPYNSMTPLLMAPPAGLRVRPSGGSKTGLPLRRSLLTSAKEDEGDAHELGGLLADSRTALRRDLDGFNQTGVCAGVCTYMWLFVGLNSINALENGGPGMLLYGFIFAGASSLTITASLAELTSSCPTASGLYFFVARLAPKRWMPYLSFMTGWMNILGAIAGLALIAQVCANMAVSFKALSLARPELRVAPNIGLHPGGAVYVWVADPATISEYDALGFYVFFVLLCTGINMISIRFSAWLCSACAFGAFLMGPLLVGTMLLVAPTHQPASFVFKLSAPSTQSTGVSNAGLSFLLGTASSVSALYGSDTVLYLAEETKNPTVAAPRGMFWGMVVTSVVGTVTIIGFMFSVQNPGALLDPGSVTGGQQMGLQGAFDIFAARSGGDGRGAFGLIMMVGLVELMSLVMWSLGTARKVYSMARDELLPGSAYLSRVSVQGVPVNAMLLIVALLLAAGPMLLVGPNQVAFSALISSTALVTFTSYLVPTVTGLMSRKSRLRPGPWNMGRWSTPVNTVAAALLLLSHVIMALPQYYPMTWLNMNYAGPTWGVVVLLLHFWWFLPRPWGARHWARGPVAGTVAGVEYRM